MSDATERCASSRDSTIIGISNILVGTLFLASGEAITKMMTASYPVGQVLVVRGSVVFLVLLSLRTMFKQRLNFNVVNSRSQLMRMVFAVTASVTFVYGLSFVPLATAVTLALSGPIFTTLFAAGLLKERVSTKKWGAAIVGFVGVLVILKPQPTGFEWAMILPVVAAISGALRDVVTRSIGHTDSSWSMLWLATIGTIVVGSTDIAVSDWQPVLSPHFAFFVLSAVLLAAAHFCLSEGFRITSASTVAPFKYTHLVWASVLGYFVWGDVPNTTVVAGSMLILLSGVTITRDIVADRSD